MKKAADGWSPADPEVQPCSSGHTLRYLCVSVTPLKLDLSVLKADQSGHIAPGLVESRPRIVWEMEVGRKREGEKPKNLDTGESAVYWTGEPGQADRSWLARSVHSGSVLSCRSSAVDRCICEVPSCHTASPPLRRYGEALSVL
ncbi:unnamed protein product [Pleuronectes platessa]|uniref:Uncharacterized protein n=1 Tax=Pleuronectes platessa TaxID=8262 RepID=A0A9N7YWJ6_PLEPL|nr:unnamed protein product [Pleuronectes platessa]